MNKLDYLFLILLLFTLGIPLIGMILNFEKVVDSISEKVVESYQPLFDEAEAMEKEYQEEISQCIEEEYLVYLDGEEVDIHKVDLSLYSFSINHEDKIIYATPKPSVNTNKTNYIPLFWTLWGR